MRDGDGLMSLVSAYLLKLNGCLTSAGTLLEFPPSSSRPLSKLTCSYLGSLTEAPSHRPNRSPLPTIADERAVQAKGSAAVFGGFRDGGQHRPREEDPQERLNHAFPCSSVPTLILWVESRTASQDGDTQSFSSLGGNE